LASGDEFRITAAFQPRRLMTAPAGDGCKRGLGLTILQRGPPFREFLPE
jgi:hypothetical protein